MELDIKITDRKALIYIANLTQTMATRLRTAIQRALIHYRDKVVENITSGKYGIKTKTGRLRGSFETNITGTGLDLRGYVGTNLIYAAIHEFGGEIKPVAAEYLTFQVGSQWIKTKNVKIKRKEYMKKTLIAEKDNILRVIAQELLTA